MRLELVHPEFVGITADGETRLASVELPVPVRETSYQKRFSKLDSRRFYKFKPYIFEEFSVLTQVSG